MNDVSVIGTGAMGSALANALAHSGAVVTVWNRSRAKAEALTNPNVGSAESVAEALSASPLVIISVTDQEIARSLVKQAGLDLDGRVLASTSFVTLDQAKAYDAMVREMGGRYLDLSIPAYPNEVRSQSGVFLLSGDRSAYEEHHRWFERISRTATFVDETPGAAYLSEMAVLLAYLPMAVGLLQGLRVCEHHKLPVEWFRNLALELYPFHIRSLLDRVAEQPDSSARNVEASVDQWRQGAKEYADYLQEMGLDRGMYDALHALFIAASEAGRGGVDWTCIAEHAVKRSS